MLLDNGHRSIEAWYFMFSICFLSASRSMVARILGSIAPASRCISISKSSLGRKSRRGEIKGGEFEGSEITREIRNSEGEKLEETTRTCECVSEGENLGLPDATEGSGFSGRRKTLEMVVGVGWFFTQVFFCVLLKEKVNFLE